VQPPVAEATAFMSDGFHPVAQRAVARPDAFVSHGHAAAANGFTRPPFAHPVEAHQMGDSFPLGSGRHHFFPKRSFNATLSSIASASIRFSLPLSSSSALRRFA
jgi:hypothetical protein